MLNVKCVMKIEEKIALKSKRLSQHFQTWDFLTELFFEDLTLFSPGGGL